MNIQESKRALLNKANELRQGQISKDEIAIERSAEMLDEIQRTSDREIALAVMTADWHTASLVAAALKRIEADEYGLCVACEEPIGQRRLTAIPWAKFCIRCQGVEDNKTDTSELAEAA